MTTDDGRHDFDFLMGAWTVRNRRRRERLTGCTDWASTRLPGVLEPPVFGSFAGDVGTWETNWTMDFTRAAH